MDPSFAGRYLNDGFSGGEKKRTEILQMALLNPSIAILDETDSGLDIDALKIVSEGVNALRNENLGILIITHYQRILNYIQPDFVHIMLNGRIVESGDADLAKRLEETGYDDVKKKYLTAASFDRYCKMLNQLCILDKTWRGEYQIIQHIPEGMNTVVLLNLVSKASWKNWFMPIEDQVSSYYNLKNI